MSVYDLLFEDLAPSEWWPLAHDLWIQSEFGMAEDEFDVWREVWETAPASRPYPLPTNVGPQVTLYRGFDDCLDHALGFAWTLREDIARRFMDRCGRAEAFSAVASVTVPAERVLLFTDARSEAEVVCVPRSSEVRILEIAAKTEGGDA